MRNYQISLPKILPAIAVALLLLAGTCKKKAGADKAALSTALLGKTWLHSHEENSGDTIIYRPNTYDFPPARGRTGFTLEPNGIIKKYDIAPTDGLEENTGHWELKDGNKLLVTFPDKKSTDFEAEIISTSPEKLKVIRRYKNQ